MASEPKVRVAGVRVLVILACLYTIYFARGFLLPIAFAFLLTFLFSPVLRAMGRARIPAPVGAALIVLLFAGAIGLCGYGLTGPVESWVAHAPETLRKAGVRLRVVEKPVNQVTRAAEQVEEAATPGASRAPEVVVKGPTLASRVFGTTQAFFEDVIEIILLLYFLLAAGDLLLEKLVRVLPHIGDKDTAVRIAQAIESSISTYLVTTAAINVGEGVIVALAMWGIGMPTPIVWGALVACMEFIPYVGISIALLVVTLASITTYPNLSHALAAPGILIVVTILQSNLVSPFVMSRRLTLNPVALFVGLAFWFWVWGIPGALLAVPLMAACKIICDHVEPLAPIGEFLSGRDAGERRHWIRSRSRRAAVSA
jgi:predicted PurR-regulated permease PerM